MNIQEVRKELTGMEGEFRKILPANSSPEKFTRIVLTAIQKEPRLLTCDKKSLFLACLNCAKDGLIPDGREAVFLPFRTREGFIVQYTPMVQGIIKKLHESKELEALTAQLIFENDKFRFWIDDAGEHLEHEPFLFEERGKFRGCYAMAKTARGVFYEVMSASEIEDVRNVSKSKDTGPWAGPFKGEMIRKTVIRRLAKKLPLSPDIQEVIMRDDSIYDFNQKKIATAIMGKNGSLPDMSKSTDRQVPRQNESLDGEQPPGELNPPLQDAPHDSTPSGMEEIPFDFPSSGSGAKETWVDVDAVRPKVSNVPPRGVK